MEDVFIVSDRLVKVIEKMRKCFRCTICQHTISDPVKTSFGHRYCRACIQRVLENKCPQCPFSKRIIKRRNISEDEHMVVFIYRMRKLIDAVKLDFDINERYVLNLHTRDAIRIASKRSSRGSSRDRHNENKSNDTSKVDLNADNPQPSTSRSNVVEKQSSQVRLMDWSTIARFVKEMDANGKNLKSLNTNIENRRKSGSFNESTTDLNEEEVVILKESVKDRRKYVEEEICEGAREGHTPKVLTQVSKAKELSERKKNAEKAEDVFSGNRKDNSITEKIQVVCESSFTTLTEGEQIRIRNSNSCQINAIISVTNEDRRAEIERDTTNDCWKPTIPSKSHVHPTNAPFENRIKVPPQMTPAGSAETRNQVSLINESIDEAGNLSPSLLQGIDFIDEYYSTPRLQASAPIGDRLSSKKQNADIRSNDSSISNADSRLQAVRRNLNRQIDQSSGNADVDNRDSIAGSSRRRDDVDYSTPVTFMKRKKVYKCPKKCARFFYLGRTMQEESIGSSYCDLRLQKPYCPVDTLNMQNLRNVRALESGFENNALVRVNETTIIEHDEGQNVPAKEIESVESARTVSTVKDTSKPMVIGTIYENSNKTDADLLTLNANEETVEPCVEHSLSKNTSATKNCQQQFLNTESPSMDALATQTIVRDSERSKGSTHSILEDEEESDASSDASSDDHSFSSQVTIAIENEKCMWFVPNTRDIDRDNADGFADNPLDVSPSSKRKRPASFDSSDEDSLREIVNKHEIEKNGTRCKKKGKWEQERDSTDSTGASVKPTISIPFKRNLFPDKRGITKLSRTESNTRTNSQTVIENEKSPEINSTTNKKKETVSEDGFWLVKLKKLLETNFGDVFANVRELAGNYKRDSTTLDKRQFLDDNRVKTCRQRSSFILSSSNSDKEDKRGVSGVLYDGASNADKTLVPERTDVTRKGLKKEEFQEEIEVVQSTSKARMIPSNSGTRLLTNQMAMIHTDITDDPTVKIAQDSLINFTEESLKMKQFEHYLFRRPVCHEKGQITSQRLKRDRRSTDKEVEHSGKEDDIVENTPDTKTKIFR